MLLCHFLSSVLQTDSEILVAVSMLAVLLLGPTELSFSIQFLFCLSNLVCLEHTTEGFGTRRDAVRRPCQRVAEFLLSSLVAHFLSCGP